MSNLTAVSLFAGVGGFDLAMQRNGIEVVAAVEIDKKCREVLAKKFPNTKLFEDVKGVSGEQLRSAGFIPERGIITGGFPCQDLSVAGLRAGLAGARSGHFFQIIRLVDELEPKFIILENVPGLLSSQQGKDMGIVITALVERRYGICWRVLDSQNFGVPQRRRRVFIVASLGNHRQPVQILFEPEGSQWDINTITKKRKTTASDVEESTRASSWAVKTIRSGARDEAGNLPAEVWTQEVVHPTLNLNDQGESRAVALVFHNSPQDGIRVHGIFDDRKAVRRLTPKECERLQGFPDDWTAGQADSNRYKQMGNAVTVNVVDWIMKRLVKVYE